MPITDGFVAVGASLGGLSALDAVFSALSPGFPWPVAVVQHRSAADVGDGFAVTLARRCPLPVREVEDKDPIEPGRVYLAPADYHLLVTREGRVKIADFGLAKQNDDLLLGLTKTNVAIGTPDFLAPEAWTPGTPLDGRADLYSLGVTLYQMVAGRLPFQADSPQALVRLIATESAPRLNRVMPDVPDDVALLCASMDMMTLHRPSEARARMFWSVQSEPLVQIMGRMPRSAA